MAAKNNDAVTLMAGGDIGPIVQPTEKFSDLIRPVLEQADLQVDAGCDLILGPPCALDQGDRGLQRQGLLLQHRQLHDDRLEQENGQHVRLEPDLVPDRQGMPAAARVVPVPDALPQDDGGEGRDQQRRESNACRSCLRSSTRRRSRTSSARKIRSFRRSSSGPSGSRTSTPTSSASKAAKSSSTLLPSKPRKL